MSWIWYAASVVVTVVFGLIASYWVLPRALKLDGTTNMHLLLHTEDGKHILLAGHLTEEALSHVLKCVGAVSDPEAADELMDTFCFGWCVNADEDEAIAGIEHGGSVDDNVEQKHRRRKPITLRSRNGRRHRRRR